MLQILTGFFIFLYLLYLADKSDARQKLQKRQEQSQNEKVNAMRIDEKLEKLRDELNSKVETGDLSSVNILELSQLIDDVIIEQYRNQEKRSLNG